MQSMNGKELAATLQALWRAGLPEITEGASGLGKTEIKHQVASKLGMRLALLHPATLDPVDLSGYPLTLEVNGEKRILRCFDDLLASIFSENEPTLLHIDEVGQCDHATQKAIAPFVSPERRINGYTLPKGVVVSLSTNSAQHRTGSLPILVHIRSRVATTLHLRPDLDAFLERATLDGIHPWIMSFLKSEPQMLYEIELLPAKMREERGLTYEKVYSSGEGYTCPRSWYRVNEIQQTGLLDRGDLALPVLAGTIGEVGSQRYVAHSSHARQNLNLDEIVLQGKAFKFPPAKEPGLRWAFSYGIAALCSKDTIGRVYEIANQLYSDKAGEYGMLIAQQVLAHHEHVIHPETRRFINSPLGKMVMEIKI